MSTIGRLRDISSAISKIYKLMEDKAPYFVDPEKRFTYAYPSGMGRNKLKGEPPQMKESRGREERERESESERDRPRERERGDVGDRDRDRDRDRDQYYAPNTNLPSTGYSSGDPNIRFAFMGDSVGYIIGKQGSFTKLLKEELDIHLKCSDEPYNKALAKNETVLVYIYIYIYYRH